MGIASVELGDAELAASHGAGVLEEHLNEPLGGIGTADLDIDTAVSTLEVGKGDMEVCPALGLRSTVHGDAEKTVDTTSAGESDLSPVLRVDVDEVLGVLAEKLAVLHAESTDKTNLLINGEEKLDGTVDKVLGLSDSKASSNTTAIISTEGGVGGTELVSVDPGDNGILLKVVDLSSSLGGNHIKVSLENNTGDLLLAGSGRDGDAGVAQVVDLHSAADLLADLSSPSSNLLGVSAGTGDLGESKEVAPDIRALGVLLAKLCIELLGVVKVEFCHLC